MTCLRLWRSLFRVVFVETPTFTKRVLQLMEDESYAALQAYLAQRPEAGVLIRGSCGMRQ